MPKSKKRKRKGPSTAERARRAKQQAVKVARTGDPATLLSQEHRASVAASAGSREEAVHVDARDWREVKIQDREAEIVQAVNSGDTATARAILEDVRANAGGCEVCKVKPEEGEGYVLSTGAGRSERRWGHRDCLLEAADAWHAQGRAPRWTQGSSFFTEPNETTEDHVPPTG